MIQGLFDIRGETPEWKHRDLDLINTGIRKVLYVLLNHIRKVLKRQLQVQWKVHVGL